MKTKRTEDTWAVDSVTNISDLNIFYSQTL